LLAPQLLDQRDPRLRRGDLRLGGLDPGGEGGGPGPRLLGRAGRLGGLPLEPFGLEPGLLRLPLRGDQLAGVGRRGLGEGEAGGEEKGEGNRDLPPPLNGEG
jgi:hypothetical protein